MQVVQEQINPTRIKLLVSVDKTGIDAVRIQVVKSLSQNVKVPGFRSGKAPANLVEKQIDPSVLQTEFLEAAVNQFYTESARQVKLRPVSPPDISITKFVPYSALEFSAEVESVGDIKLPNYKNIKLSPQSSQPVTAKDIDQVLENLRDRSATKKTVNRAANKSDEVIIDFEGQDAKTQKPIDGADGKQYPLILGSQTFIPGFEEQLIGLKASYKKEFVLTFPADYGTASLSNRRVKFNVSVNSVQELSKPKLDNNFATNIGPFKTLAELKNDIKKQLTSERLREAAQANDNQLIDKIAAQTEVSLPTPLVDEEINRMEEEEKRNIAYRGQTWQEHLTAEGLTEDAHREQKRPAAEQRIKAGLILGEIAEKEQITNTPEELEMRIELLRGQYTDAAMRDELDKPENRRDINFRMLTEKTLDRLRSYAVKQN
ncbi:MAG TPA: trigger factor [Candidatus Saccharimonadales bacterium]|nr:trigger factor [Candidatus Saccharimonadales bacterium]